MTAKFLPVALYLLICPLAAMAQASTTAEETTHEIVLPRHIQERLDYRKKSSYKFNNEMTAEDKAKASTDYSYIDPNRIIPTKLREEALAYFDKNKNNFSNQKYITIINFSAHSSKARFFLVDMKTGKVQPFHTAHGKGSDSNNDGYAERFSNSSGSEMSSVGYYRVAETYSGKHGYSVRLDGLSATNSNARARAVVIHPANYVSESSSKAGRSWGCPAVDPKYSSKIIDLIKNGSLLYANVTK